MSGSRRRASVRNRLVCVVPVPLETEVGSSRHGVLRRVAGFVVGIALLGVAVWVVVSNHGAVSTAIDSAGDASWMLIVAAVVLPLVHWHCTSVVFWLMMRRFGMVRLGEMHLLIGSAGLLNYLPMRPGMFGRLAYHKSVNRIRVHDSVRVTIECTVLTAVANGVAIVAALVSFHADPLMAWVTVGSPLVVMVVAGLWLTSRVGSVFAPPSSYVWALAVRYVDTLAWIWRYAIAFAIIGHPISATQASVFAGAAQLAMMVPFVGNGLGVREWGIGLAFPFFQQDAARAIGLTGDLLNRATEVLTAVPIGLVCMAILARQHRSSKAGSSA